MSAHEMDDQQAVKPNGSKQNNTSSSIELVTCSSQTSGAASSPAVNSLRSPARASASSSGTSLGSQDLSKSSSGSDIDDDSPDSEREPGCSSSNTSKTNESMGVLSTSTTSSIPIPAFGEKLESITVTPHTPQKKSSTYEFIQTDDTDQYTCGLFIQMIENMRARCIRDEDARIILLRRAEALTDIFPNWTERAFNSSGEYTPFDLNMPKLLRKRECFRDFLADPPLTNIGAHFSQQLGYSMLEELPETICSAPELACLQTGRKLLEGIAVGVEWSVEPGLAGFIPPHVQPPKLDVKLNKETVMTVAQINDLLGKETIEEFHKRIAKVISKMEFPASESTIIVAQDSVVDSIIQTFVRSGKELSSRQRISLETRIPCLSMMHFDVKEKGKWRPSAASLPGLLTSNTQPDVCFLTRPFSDF